MKTAKFDHAILNNKTLCQSFLREHGVARDWHSVRLAEMQKMLAKYSDAAMFAAAKRIMEAEGETYDQTDFEVGFDDEETAEAEAEADAIDAAIEDANRKPAKAGKRRSKIESAPAPAPAREAEAVTDVEPKPAKPNTGSNAGTVSTAVATVTARPEDDDAGLIAMAKALRGALGNRQVDPEQVAAIAKVVAKGVAEQVYADANTALSASLLALIDAKVTEGLKTVKPRELIVRTQRSEVKIEGIQHFKFDTLLRACNAITEDGLRMNIWLYGPPGTGKTTAARNAAKALDLAFHATGALLTKYDITGFIAAQGNLIRSPFREAWEHGGVFLFDEIDGSDPRAIVSFNSALANGVMAFPDGMIARHKDCVMIAAANTNGHGATAEFSGRFKMDLASMDRFVMLNWPIDNAVEMAMATNKTWADTVQRVRTNVVKLGLKNMMVTPRAVLYGQALIASGVSIDETKEMVLRKGMAQEQWSQVNA